MNRRYVMIGGGSLALVSGAAALGVRQTGSSSFYDKAGQAMRGPLPARPADRELIRYATLAPNSHNTQPWR